MDLATLIERRRSEGAGSLREMARRAADAGLPISHVQLAAYAKGGTTAVPSEETRRKLAAALGVSVEEVTAAALESAAPELRDHDARTLEQARAFLRLTEGRSDEEIKQLLGVIRATLAAFDSVRDAR